jgi:hypothetical protein
MSEEKKEKKIIIDEDWKAEAQKEKETADDEAKIEKEKAAQPQMPKGDMAGLVSMLSSQAAYALGLMQIPGQKEKPEVNLDMARFSIDLLEVLAEKTKGNLTDEEHSLLDGTLHQLRMAFVQLSGGEKTDE